MVVWSMLAYNLLMLLVDAAALVALRRRRTVRVWLALIAGAGGMAVVLAMALGRGHFGVLLLMAFGAFLHGTLAMAGSAWILWTSRRSVAVLAGLIAVGLVAVGVEAFLVEPTWLEVTHFQIASPKIQRPLRIVVLADLQTDQLGDYERRVLRETLQEQPDMILLAGDYFQTTKAQLPLLQREVNQFLREVKFAAPQGVFAVRGNAERRDWQETFQGLPVEASDDTRSFDVGDLHVTCLSMQDSFNPSLVCPAPSSSRFHLVLGHSPNFALGRVEADLLVAGHTHGGQVRLPGIGPLTTLSKVPRAWAAGLTELPGGGKLLVSRGVGLERGPAPRLRFLCRPQLVVIDLVPQNSSGKRE
jgi:predicted MPP superfamily phosphohydrolase